MKKIQAQEKYGPLFIVALIILGGLYAGGRTGHYHNLVVIFASLGSISLGLAKLFSLLFKKLPAIFKPLHLVTQAGVVCSFVISLFYLLK